MKKSSFLLISAAIMLVPKITFAACSGYSFKSIINGQSSDVCSYQQWIGMLWPWATGIAVSLATIMIAFAGVVWMTSGGDPEKVTRSKKMIYGALSGIALLVLARVLLITILGLPFP